MEFIFHNPPGRKGKARRSKKARRAKRAVRRVSAKQRANWARFARMAKARARGMEAADRAGERRAKARLKGKRRRSNRKRRRIVRSTYSDRRATTMPRSRKSSRRRGGRSRAGLSARGFSLNPRSFLKKDMVMEAGGVLVTSIVVPKIIAKLGTSTDANGVTTVKGWLKDAQTNGISGTKYMLAKTAVGLVLAAVAAKMKQPMLAKGLAVGAISQLGYDLVQKTMPAVGAAPAALHGGFLAGGVDGEYLDVGGTPIRLAA